MDQSPPDSHWATASHSDSVAAEAVPAVISGAATTAPVRPATAMARLALEGRRCLPWQENDMEVSPHRRLRGELSGSGYEGRPAAHLPVHGFTPSRSGDLAAGHGAYLVPPLLPTAHDATTCPVRPLAGLGVTAAGARWSERFDVSHAHAGISKTIRASETHLSLLRNQTFQDERVGNSPDFARLSPCLIVSSPPVPGPVQAGTDSFVPATRRSGSSPIRSSLASYRARQPPWTSWDLAMETRLSPARTV